MAETRGNWVDLVEGVGLEIAEVFDQGQEEYTPGYMAVVQKSTGTGAQENYRSKTGAGRLQGFSEGDDLPERRRYLSYLTSVTWNNYGAHIDVTKNMIEDRNADFAAALDEMKDLSISANFSQDESAVQLFNGGFATTTAVNGYTMTWYGDGNPLFSTVHATPVPGASTQSNASATGIKFGVDNLETAMIALREQKTDDGLPLALLGKETLVLPLPLQREGLEITQSKQSPEDANNAINVFNQGMSADMVTSMFLDAANGGSDNAWFLVVPGRARLFHTVRQEARLEMDKDIKNKTVTFTVDARWADLVKDWKRTWGSKGDLAAYSS